MKPLLVMDRDGVLNTLVYDTPNGRAPRKFAEIEYLAKKTHIKLLQKRFKIICVTNQPDASNGRGKLGDIYLLHNTIMEYYEITHSVMCQHNNSSLCDCRKPGTLMLEMAQTMTESTYPATIIGDRWTDILAGNRLGWRTILLERDKFAMAPTSQGSPPEKLCIDRKVRDWSEILDYLLKGDI